MQRTMGAVLAVAFCAGTSAWAQGDRAGAFDYYVMALSWSPTYCALEGNAEGAEQCAPGEDVGWMLHGLWPQHERGWPADCPTREGEPSRRTTGAMADLMGSGGLAYYQWRKHGRCSGLSAGDYFALSREAFDAVTRPPVFRALDRDVSLPARVVEEAWLEANPGLRPDMLTVTCRDGHIQEVRICLTKSLVPRFCGPDVVRDCTLSEAIFPSID
ncbi:MAG: ribonuclease T2 [Pseudomonadota bacterium]